ncbi:MAG TPA: N-acetyltransferase [Pyrinomonadaceae bacterium]|nr:N-acetyltransferase [Pyrinomonadaceae bacterium]
MTTTFIIHANVALGANHRIDDFVIIGAPARESQPGEVATSIGPNAIIRSHTVIYAGNHIGANFQTGHSVMIRESNEIGDDVSIGTHSNIEHHVKIGNRVRIHSRVFIPEYSILEDDAWVGPGAVFTNDLYPPSHDASALKGPHLMPGARVGANVTLLPGVIIGRNALVGAGAVVVCDVPDGKVVVGNPARIIKDVSELTADSVERIIGQGG